MTTHSIVPDIVASLAAKLWPRFGGFPHAHNMCTVTF